MSWQKIETAPKDGTRFDGYGYYSYGLTVSSQGHRFTNCCYSTLHKGFVRLKENSYEVIQAFSDETLTHWQPLPEPPEGE